MHRCALSGRALLVPALWAVLLMALPLPSQAQVTGPLARQFPPTALRGELQIEEPPSAKLNGKAIQLAPGARIRDESNLIALSSSLTGRKLVVNYTTDATGQPLDVWILRPEERARQPWPTTPAQAASWQFDLNTQTWSKP